MMTTMNTGAASLSDEQKRAAITACALMIKGICLTTPNAEWTERIENRIHYLLRQIATTPQAEAAPIINGHAINDLFLKWSEWTTELGEAISRKNIDGFVSELRAAIAAGGAQEAVGSERKAETATLILRGELVNVGIDESGIGDMELIVGARGVLLSGLSQEETKALAPFLFQQVTLAVAYNGEQEVQS